MPTLFGCIYSYGTPTGVDVLLYICVSYRLLTYPAERVLAAVQVPAERVPAEWSAQGLRA